MTTLMPQLRVRTEYSFRTCYGPLARVAERLQVVGAPAAGIVDTLGTWGHVQWAKALGSSSSSSSSSSACSPLFGCEFRVELAHGAKPACWVLATDLAAFYRLSSHPPRTPEDLIGAAGVVRFAGAALTDPETFDYIDINPRSRRQTLKALALARKTGKPLALTSDNDYPAPADRARFLAWDNSQKMTPQHIATVDELRAAMWYVGARDFAAAVEGAHAAAQRCSGLHLAEAPLIAVEGDIAALCAAGQSMRLARGHIVEWTPEYQARLDYELNLIAEKGYASYFMVVAEVMLWAKARMLVGPARGSSAGSLVCYLMQITEVDPIVHNLIFERFIDVNRFDLPDIDLDFNDQKREQVFEHLAERYGAANVARIGSVNRLKPRSLIAHVGKKMAIPASATFGVTNVLIEYSSGDSRYGKGLEDTLNNTRPGQAFVSKFPEATLMGELEDHASHSGQHAAGIIVANSPVTNYCTVRNGIAHIDKKDAEHLGLLKIDALGLRTLGVIEDTGCITPQELYDLKLDDPKVLAIFNEHKFSGVFQFEGPAQRRVSGQVPVLNFRQIDHITALARPGPLGGGATNTYINRNAGREPVTYAHPSMASYLEDTKGVVLYQEQVMRICRDIGQFSWADTATIRRLMSKSVGAETFNRFGEQFVTGAGSIGVPLADAKAIWDDICSFGAWGMNKSHTVSYAIISYWCAYMKHHHQLEYAAACLRNAKDDDQTMEILRELKGEGVEYTPFDIDHSGVGWAAEGGRLIGGYTNLIGIGRIKAARYVELRDAGKLTDADRAKLLAMPQKHSDLAPAHTLWGDLYASPSSHNIHGAVREFAQLVDQENCVVIAKLSRLERRDENETVLVAKRGGELRKGQTLFLDAFVVDDSVSKPVRARLRPARWTELGEPLADGAVAGQDWFLIRGRWLDQFSMIIVEKIKCLTNPDLFKK